MSKRKDTNLAAVKLKNFFKNNSILVGVLVFIVLMGTVVVVGNDGKADENLVYGDDVIDMHFFHLSTCPHCHRQIAYHPTLKEKFPNMRILEYEITSEASKQKYVEMAQNYPELNPTNIATPTTIIGGLTNVGYGTDETSGVKLEQMLQVEQDRIDANWDDATMTRTVDLRAQQAE